MEFPNLGVKCPVEDCKRLNFEPFSCKHCHILFCIKHFDVVSHNCKNFHKTKLSSYLCSDESCTQTSAIEMLCVKCKKHSCLQHRYHGCLEYTNEERTTKLKKWQIPKKQFAEAKAIVDQEISNNLKKSKNTAMANKVRLMRIKGSAVGPKTVPMNERCYFLVYASIKACNKNVGPSKGIYVNMNWIVEKAINSMAEMLKIPNSSDIENAAKLHLFHHSTGTLISNAMDIPLTKLFENSELVDGQSVILEYSNDTSVNTTLYK
ncbi:AN1-type zinc finger protein 1-like [Calliopsis andreniformis]|uniref:AN1-type zinc finger protein 1-like n=1 Tax=Calliopsis andreniformis TaxID=337506 RepID=UPI003FCCB87F